MIQAKPTRYQGILYRSKLEATWAVFFTELYGKIERVVSSLTPRVIYEPNWAASAIDFGIYYGPDDYRVGYQVKPIMPNDDYLRGLRQAQEMQDWRLGKDQCIIFLTTGSLSNDDAAFHPYPYLEHYTESVVTHGMFYNEICDNTEVEGILQKLVDAYLAAKHFRWDLYRGD
jgi:hypothetical protein